MSQAGILDVENSNPQIPTRFNEDNGFAVPIANVLEILGGEGIDTSGSGNTVTISGEDATAGVNVGAANKGISAFDSAMFTVTDGFVQLSGGGLGIDEILTDSGSPSVKPDSSGIVNFLGGEGIDVTGQGPGNTVTISGELATYTNLGIASFDSGDFTVTGGHVVLNGSGVGQTITGDNGLALSPTLGNWNLLGSGSITTSGAGSTLTTQLTGLTNHAVLIGAGTSTITKIGPIASTGAVLQSNGLGSDPGFSTATYPSIATGIGTILRADGTNWVATTATYPTTTTINQILYSSSSNVIGGLTTANQGVLTTGATGIPVITALATNGQLIIGSTAGVPAASTLTAGAGISITNGSNSITIAATGAGFTWSETSGAFAAVKENGYFITTTATATLPASPTEGDAIKFSVDTTNLLTITANTGQFLRFGTSISASAGTAVNTQRGDSVELVYKSTGTVWIAQNFVGGWSIT